MEVTATIEMTTDGRTPDDPPAETTEKIGYSTLTVTTNV